MWNQSSVTSRAFWSLQLRQPSARYSSSTSCPMNLKVFHIGWWQQALFPALCKHRVLTFGVSTKCNVSNTSGCFFPWPREVSSNMGWSVLCWTLRGHLSHLSSATSVELTPLWHSLWELLSARASWIFNSTSSIQEVFWALVWVPLLLFQPGGSQGRKMLNCSAHLIHFLFLEDPCFCCLISNNLKNVVSYNFSYIYCFSVLFFLSWDCKSSPCCSISARSQSFCYTSILLNIFIVF